jgi:hypothetical protein
MNSCRRLRAPRPLAQAIRKRPFKDRDRVFLSRRVAAAAVSFCLKRNRSSRMDFRGRMSFSRRSRLDADQRFLRVSDQVGNPARGRAGQLDRFVAADGAAMFQVSRPVFHQDQDAAVDFPDAGAALHLAARNFRKVESAACRVRARRRRSRSTTASRNTISGSSTSTRRRFCLRATWQNFPALRPQCREWECPSVEQEDLGRRVAAEIAAAPAAVRHFRLNPEAGDERIEDARF